MLDVLTAAFADDPVVAHFIPCDVSSEGVGAYLEASGRRNRRPYQRLGVVDHGAQRLPARRPRARRDQQECCRRGRKPHSRWSRRRRTPVRRWSVRCGAIPAERSQPDRTGICSGAKGRTCDRRRCHSAPHTPQEGRHDDERAAADEGTIAVPGGEVWYASVGEGDLPPLLVVHGGPGFLHDYLTPLDDLATDRRVIYWDQLGCGCSERPDDESLWTMERSVREVDAVREALGLDRHHLIGHSWGGMLVQQYVLDRTPDLLSLTVANSVASMPRFSRDVLRLKAQLPQDVQDTIDHHEDQELYACPEYQGAIAVWFRTFICRMQPWPLGLEKIFADISEAVYGTMWGPSDFRVTGNLKDWDVMDRLPEIAIPTLIVAGRYDEFTPEHMRSMHDRVEGAEWACFEYSAHLPFHEEQAEFMRALADFLGRHDAAS